MDVFGIEVPFVDHCGITAVGADEGVTRLRVDPAPHLCNQLGSAHGGLIATLLDVALASAARLRAGRAMVTLDMQVSFIGPGTGALAVEGRVIRAGASVTFCEAEVRREVDGAIVARGTGLFMPARAKMPSGD